MWCQRNCFELPTVLTLTIFGNLSLLQNRKKNLISYKTQLGFSFYRPQTKSRARKWFYSRLSYCSRGEGSASEEGLHPGGVPMREGGLHSVGAFLRGGIERGGTEGSVSEWGGVCRPPNVPTIGRGVCISYFTDN